jgi:multiple sugar transport system substrate-binding protein
MIRKGRDTFRLRRTISALFAASVLVAACGGSDTATPADGDDAAATTGQSGSEPTSKPAVDPDGRTVVRWFVGLGTGSQAEQIDRENAFVEKFNKSQDTILLEVEYVDNKLAKDALAAEIAGGNPPDIIGPVGREGAQAFDGQYLNLDPLISAADFDLSIYDQKQVEAYRNEAGELLTLPFASFPTALYYNKSLFDEAGLPYPPATYGEPYGVGTEYEGEWNIDKLTEISKILSVDANGNDATNPSYDKSSIVQWGFAHQWTQPPRAQGTFFGAGDVVGDDGKAKVPEQWVEEWKWYNALIFECGCSPSESDQNSDALGGDNVFNSGKVAMARTHLWYTCCLNDGGSPPTYRTDWDVAALPSYNGTVTTNLHADTFRIHKDSKNPDAAFEVLSYMMNEGALDLLTIYGAMPARADIRDAYFAKLDEQYTQGVNWQVFLDGLEYIDVPSHEATMPNFVESDKRIKELEPLLRGEANLDIDAEVTKLQSDLDAIWAAAG